MTNVAITEGDLADPAETGIPERDIFVSHRNTDEDIALSREICEGLSTAGVTSWLDKERLAGGASYRREITEAIRKARAVIVIFDHNPSDWLIFEAGCAFFDHKLIPVTVNGAPVPDPFSGIQAVELPDADHPDRRHKMLELLRLCRHKVKGRGSDGLLLRVASFVHSLFQSGLSVLYVVFAALLTYLLGVATDGGDYSVSPLYDTLHHTHAVLGMLTLGGGLFLPIFFARAQASPSFRERQFGAKTALDMFGLWLFVALILMVIGGLMLAVSDRRYSIGTPWVSLSMVLYLLSLILWIIGIWLAQSGSVADRDGDRRNFTIRTARASVAFLLAFAINVTVVNLMLFKYDLTGALPDVAGAVATGN